ncbi:MAG: hypothetical protein GF355_12105, partial [Candidatus Eisenbacteria bacterium]|nr:hypothetical protein [Candidatus Eisenbacteria bacterium]
TRANLFAHAVFNHQTSNIDAFAFDQIRLQAGVEYSFLNTGSRQAPEDTAVLRWLDSAGGGAGDLAPRIERGGVRFLFRAPEASRVAVVGGFNHWDAESDPLRDPDRDGIWEVAVPVPEGLWRYAFVVDGDWKAPPDAPRYEPDGFGGTNGILEVPPETGL